MTWAQEAGREIKGESLKFWTILFRKRIGVCVGCGSLVLIGWVLQAPAAVEVFESCGHVGVTWSVRCSVDRLCIWFMFLHTNTTEVLPPCFAHSGMLQETVGILSTFNCIRPLYLRNQRGTKKQTQKLVIILLLVSFWTTAVPFGSRGQGCEECLFCKAAGRLQTLCWEINTEISRSACWVRLCLGRICH